MTSMSSLRSDDGTRILCALLAAALILPVLAYAERADDNDGTDNGKGKDHGDKHGHRGEP